MGFWAKKKKKKKKKKKEKIYVLCLYETEHRAFPRFEIPNANWIMCSKWGIANGYLFVTIKHLSWRNLFNRK